MRRSRALLAAAAGGCLTLSLSSLGAAPALVAPADSPATAADTGPALAVQSGETEQLAALDPTVDYRRSSGVTETQVAGTRAYVDVRGKKADKPPLNHRSEAPRPRAIDGTTKGSNGKPGGGGGAADPSLQSTAPANAAPAATVSFTGMTFAANGAGWPPDTVGAVGPNDFVQAVNTSLAFYSKTGVSRGSQTMDQFFPASSGVCDSNNQGDPTVNYDTQSHRWIITDFAWEGSLPAKAYYQCIAVSPPDATPAATTWTFYPVLVSTTDLNDYPKVASGPDAVFITYNLFKDASAFAGTLVQAIDRSSLGSSSLIIRSAQTGTAYGALLAANITGPGPVDEPLVSLGNAALETWTFHTGYSNGTAATFSAAPTLVPVAPYTAAGQITTPGEAVDSLSDRAMNMAQYQNGSLWVAHSVSNGVRWYELAYGSGAPTLRQQSTFGPADGLSRWMPALAVDKQNNLTIGYSVSSRRENPDLRFAGRKAGDALNQLTYGEGLYINGTGAPRSQYNRWGDYGQMTIDPDGCTFWFTSEFYASTGNNWQTRIAANKLPGCV